MNLLVLGCCGSFHRQLPKCMFVILFTLTQVCQPRSSTGQPGKDLNRQHTVEYPSCLWSSKHVAAFGTGVERGRERERGGECVYDECERELNARKGRWSNGMNKGAKE